MNNLSLLFSLVEDWKEYSTYFMEIGLNWTGKAAKWIFLDTKIDEKFVEKMMTFLKSFILYYKYKKGRKNPEIFMICCFAWINPIQLFPECLTRLSWKFCRNEGPPCSTQIEGFYIVILIPCYIWVLWGK